MSDSIQAEQIPVQTDKRKIMNPEKLELLRLARETRARNRIAREEKQVELAKQMILTSVNAPKSKTESDPEKKKLKWESRKSELVAEIRDILLKEKRPVQTPVDSESEEEELPQKRPKKEKKSKSAPAVQKKAKKSSSHLAGKEHTKVSRKPVKRAVYDESEQSDESSESESEPEHAQHVLKLW